MRRNVPAFFDAPRSRHSTTSGDVELPILYFDASALYAYFPVDLDKAATKLVGLGLEPVRFSGSQTMVGVAFYEYRDTSIGPYNEVGVAITVCPTGERLSPVPMTQLLVSSRRRKLGFAIIDLPVSTQAACDAGRELWGYPKFVTELPIRFSGRQIEAAVIDPTSGKEMVTLAGSRGRGAPLPGFDLLLLSEVNGQKLRTVVDVRALCMTGGGGDLRLSVAESDHVMAQNLIDLGLAGKRPLLVQYCTRFQSRLNAGEPY